MNVEIKKIGINGEGIAYIDKKPVFVDRTLIDEVVDIKDIVKNKTYMKASLNRIIKESKERIEAPCRNYNKCSGCSLMHTTYDNQLRIKKSEVKEAFYKYADINIGNLDIEKSPKVFNYRNCLKLPFINHKGKLKTGLYIKDSNSITAIDNCLIHEELLEDLREKVLAILNKYNVIAYDKKTKKGFRYLVIREIGSRAHMCLITGEENLDSRMIEELSDIKEIVSIYQCINTSKNSVDIFSSSMIHLSLGKHLVFKIDDLKFNLSIKSFYQLNSKQAKNLYKYVVDLLEDKQDLIVEAYAGIGAISLLASHKAKTIKGIEYVKDAVVNANVNAHINHINNVEFLCGDAAKLLETNFYKQKIDTLIVDPPRSGLDEKMLEVILKTNIKNIIYISCNPSTLAKNINELKKKYIVSNIKAFDMFPNTAHVETVVLMSRVDKYRG